MPEDFTTYTEVDTSGKLTVTSSRCTWASLDDEVAYLYKDKGADYFNSDFEHHFTVQITTSAANTDMIGWLLANGIGSHAQLQSSQLPLLFLQIEANALGAFPSISPFERISGSGNIHYGGDDIVLVFDTLYYCTMKRLEGVGTYGTLYLYVYTNSARTSLLDSTFVTLHAKIDFRYVYAVNNYADADGTKAGFLEDLLLSISNPKVFYI